MHRVNIAERVIHTCKHHFKAILASVDPTFPMSQWDKLLEQAQLMLNLLKLLRVSPSMSAHASLFGDFDFCATPLGPPCTRVVAHTKPGTRRSWSLNDKDS